MRVASALGLLAAGLVLGPSGGSTSRADSADAEAADLRTFHDAVEPLLKQRCFGCHGPRQHKADLRLDRIDGDLVRGQDGSTWKEVYDRLNAGEMPPKTAPQPATRDVDKVVAWIASETRKAERVATGAGGRSILRRLNRVEYTNTLRDLLHVEFPYGDGPLDSLPPDGTAGGFDKIGSALMLDPSLLAGFLTVARRVADTAVVAGPPPFATQRRRYSFADTARSSAIGYECKLPSTICRSHDLVLMENWARTWDGLQLDPKSEATIPIDGHYTIRVRMSADLGRRGEPLKVRLVWPVETRIAEWTLTKADAVPRVFEVTLPIKLAGKNREGPQIHLVNGTPFPAMDRAQPGGAKPAPPDTASLPKLILDWIELEGPILSEWPPASQKEIFFEGPQAKPDRAYAERIFRRLLPRAYRRPVTDAEVAGPVDRVARELAAGETFEEAIKVGLEDMLCAPQFLYLSEPNAGPPRALTDYELAARLSYFLWSSMPDAGLFAQAAAGRLHDRAVLVAEAKRMLKDPKSRAFVDGFGAAWLQSSRFVGIPPNRRIYTEWDDDLEAAAKREPIAFFDEILRHDLSALNFLDSDFAMLNARLAKHYGIAGVEGTELRRVKLPAGSQRGGLLTQAGILSIGSDGTRTLPVRRASWVLQTLFNAPPPPPPPNAGEVEPNTGTAHPTVRQRLIAHQKIPACASCHVRLDPYGLGLESYDAVGAWRTRQNGEDLGAVNDRAPLIDASGVLPDGRRFASSFELRRLLAGDHERFSRALGEKMLAYALGRGVGPADDETINAVVAEFRRQDHRLSALITAIVTSHAFGAK